MEYDIKAKDAAEASNYSRDSIIRAAQAGTISSLFAGKPWIFNRAEVMAWAAGREAREVARRKTSGRKRKATP